MNTVKRLAAGAWRLITGPLCAVIVLAVLSVGVIAYVSANMRVYTVIDGTESYTVLSLSSKPKDVIASAGLVLGDDDEYEENNGEISVHRAFDVQVTVDGSTTVVRMTGGTVGDALKLLGVKVDEDDTVNMKNNQQLSDGIAITVERVNVEEYTKTEPIPYEKKIKYTNTLKEGKTLTHTEGKKGIKTYVYRDRYVDGELVETVLISEEVTEEPVTEVILKGTTNGSPLSKAPFDIELDENGQPVHYKAVYTGLATAYTNEGGILSDKTASGMKAQVGVIAVDPKLIPYGTKLYIVAPNNSYIYGYAVAGDTGNRVRQGVTVADLFMDTVLECYQFGKRTVNVYVLE